MLTFLAAINRIPVIMAVNKTELGKNLTRFWNDEIQRQNVQFLESHSDARSTFYDPLPLFNRILDHPHRYGAPNNTCLSYPDGTPCLWHDFIHPVSRILSSSMISSDRNECKGPRDPEIFGRGNLRIDQTYRLLQLMKGWFIDCRIFPPSLKPSEGDWMDSHHEAVYTVITCI